MTAPDLVDLAAELRAAMVWASDGLSSATEPVPVSALRASIPDASFN